MKRNTNFFVSAIRYEKDTVYRERIKALSAVTVGMESYIQTDYSAVPQDDIGRLPKF
jgi:hypothetical protein